MGTFLEEELLLFNIIIENNDYTVIRFLKEIGVNITYSYIKGDMGYYEGWLFHKLGRFHVKAKSNKREIIELRLS